MALTNFLPDVWASQIQRSLDKALAFANDRVVNTAYEGDVIEYGKSVKINMISDVTIKDYTKNTDMDAPETLSDTQYTLNIDRAKYFNFQVDDIDKVQSRPKVMAEAVRRSAQGLIENYDAYTAVQMATGTAAGNILGAVSGTVVTASNAYEYLVDLGVVLSQNDVPLTDRFVVVTPAFHGYLLKDDRFVGNGTGANMETLYEGLVGRAGGFDIWLSNQHYRTNASGTYATTGGVYYIQAGWRDATASVQQIQTVEAYRMEKRLADGVKGLHVGGVKVTRPASLAVLRSLS